MKRKTKADPRRKRGLAIVADAKAGMHIHELREKYGLTDTPVRDWLKKFNVAVPPCNCLRQKGSAMRIIALKQDGMRSADIAREMGVSPQRISGVCKDAREAGVKGC